MIKEVILLCTVAVIMSTIAFAHSNILYDVNLDFDMDLKNEITETAQEFFKTKESPKFFDYDRELITVKFERNLEYSVIINPLTMDIHGFRDDSKAKITGNADSTTRKESAQKVFDSIPEKYKLELNYGEEEKLYLGVYKHTWYRYLNGVFVANDHLEVEINSNGEVVAWRLSPFFYDSEKISTEPAISAEVAKYIASFKFNGNLLDFEPILLIYKTDPVWVVRIKTLYPIYVGVNSLNGDVLFTGGIRTGLPEGYNVSKTARPSEFIREVQEK